MCSARSFGSASSSSASAVVFFGRGAALARAGDRPHRDHVAFEPHQDFRRRADHMEIIEVEVKHVRRRIERAQRAVQRERRGVQAAWTCAATAPPA